MSHAVIIRNAVKKYGNFVALNGVNLDIHPGEFFTLLGPSGCGKTTLLRMIAGFNTVDGGEIYFDEKLINRVEAHKRDIGMVFQNYAIFPHLTVAENVAYGLKAKKVPKAEIARRVDEALDLVQIRKLKDRKPNELSGGQQQRVALARALVTRPAILLLDEPLSNLDAKLRVEMQVEIKRIQKELGITTIIVTHDHEEAVSLADRVIVMNAGQILQIGTPQEIFDRPSSPFVADFMGFSTFIHGIMGPEGNEHRQVTCSGRTLFVTKEAARGLEEGASCLLSIRSENISLAQTPGENTVPGRVESATYKGHTTRLEVSGCFAEMVYPAISGYAETEAGREVLVHFPADRICVYRNNN